MVSFTVRESSGGLTVSLLRKCGLTMKYAIDAEITVSIIIEFVDFVVYTIFGREDALSCKMIGLIFIFGDKLAVLAIVVQIDCLFSCALLQYTRAKWADKRGDESDTQNILCACLCRQYSSDAEHCEIRLAACRDV